MKKLRIYILLPILLTGIIFTACKNRKTPGLYTKDSTTEIIVKSSCRLSSLDTVQKELAKTQVLQFSKSSIERLKIKTISSLKKNGYRLARTQLILIERCGVKTSDGSPFIGLSQLIELENIQNRQIVQFQSDTTVMDQAALGQPQTIVPKKKDLKPYIEGLTYKNYLKIKNSWR